MTSVRQKAISPNGERKSTGARNNTFRRGVDSVISFVWWRSGKLLMENEGRDFSLLWKTKRTPWEKQAYIYIYIWKAWADKEKLKCSLFSRNSSDVSKERKLLYFPWIPSSDMNLGHSLALPSLSPDDRVTVVRDMDHERSQNILALSKGSEVTDEAQTRHPPLALCPWKSYSASLGLSSLLCNMSPTSKDCFRD